MVRVKHLLHLLVCGMFAVGAAVACGQEPVPQPEPRPVTDDEVNAISHRLYCPVCENITLDTCGTAACADWRAEVRLMLEAGYTEEQIVSDFVRRFGDRVVGTPQDPLLAALSLATPWLLIGGGLFAALTLFRRWRGEHAKQPIPAVPQQSDRYLDLLEQDLSG